MSQQDIIKEGIRERIYNIAYAGLQIGSDQRTQELLEYLGSKGVVIKVECPDCCWSQFSNELVGMTPCYSCNSTGYIIESLI